MAESSHKSLLARETELQKLLATEKMRSEQHKSNYTALKVEHASLQSANIQLQNENKSFAEQCQQMEKKYKIQQEEFQVELLAKRKDIEEIRSQIITEQNVDVLRLQIKEETEEVYQNKFLLLQQEIEQLQTDLSNLRYENSFLKSEYKHTTTQHDQLIKEIKLRNEAEVLNLRKEKESLLSRTQVDGNQDQQRLRNIQKENAQLHLRLKGLLEELDSIRSERENSGLQSDHVTRLQTKQLAENTALIKSMEAEKYSLNVRLENLQKDISLSSHLRTELTSKVHDLEKDNLHLKNKNSEVAHNCKVDISNLKIELLKERGQVERDRDQLRNQVEELQSKLEIAEHSIQQQTANILEKEKESVKLIQLAREEEWLKINKVENEKLDLETKLQELERKCIDEETRIQLQREKTDEQIKNFLDAKEYAEREALVCRTKLQNQESLLQQIEQERLEKRDIQGCLQRLRTEVNTYISSEQELLDINLKLKKDHESMIEELQKHRIEVSRSKDGVDKLLAEQRANWLEERTILKQNTTELECNVEKNEQKMEAILTSYAKKKKKYNQIISKLKNKNTLLAAQVEELTIERDHLKKYVPIESHTKLKKQLNDLLRRHREFHTILTSADMNEVRIGDHYYSSVQDTQLNKSLDIAVLNTSHQNQKDVEQIKERLDLLENNQVQQLSKLRTVTKMISPIPTPNSEKDSISENSDS